MSESRLIRTSKFLTIVPFCDLLAGELHVAEPEAQPFPCAAQPLSSQFHFSRSSPVIAPRARSKRCRGGAQRGIIASMLFPINRIHGVLFRIRNSTPHSFEKTLKAPAGLSDGQFPACRSPRS